MQNIVFFLCAMPISDIAEDSTSRREKKAEMYVHCL